MPYKDRSKEYARKKTPEYRKQHAAAKKRYNDATADTAINSHQRFSEKEDEIVQDKSISAKEAAKRLGRTLDSIYFRRWRLKKIEEKEEQNNQARQRVSNFVAEGASSHMVALDIARDKEIQSSPR